LLKREGFYQEGKEMSLNFIVNSSTLESTETLGAKLHSWALPNDSLSERFCWARIGIVGQDWALPEK